MSVILLTPSALRDLQEHDRILTRLQALLEKTGVKMSLRGTVSHAGDAQTPTTYCGIRITSEWYEPVIVQGVTCKRCRAMLFKALEHKFK